jgi:hypothetical protein
MSKGLCWGIFREHAHSPGRVSDDTEILRMTGKDLEAKGYEVVLKNAEELATHVDGWPRHVFLMCERLEALALLRNLEQDGVTHVNSPRAVLNTYRDRMIATLAEAGVPFVTSELVDTAVRLVRSAPAGAAGPAAARSFPLWVKRADVHNTQDGDVVLAADAGALDTALRGLAARGIARAVLQPHVAGDLVKFYGVGTVGARRQPEWFACFYHKEQVVAGHPYDRTELARLVRRAASALGLEIYGGDAIVTADRGVVILDVNAWPSFALYRDEAAPRIAAYLDRRFSGARR